MDNILWLEKHRPQTLDDVVGNPHIIGKLKLLAQEQNVPHMILVGPPGCGKTTSVLALAHTILKDNSKNACIELNASDERGIDVVRTKIKQFAEKKVNLPPGQHKIIILDEADSLTESSQQALRMIITDFSDSTRFVFSCNDSTKLIEPIQSRCAILRFSRLNDDEIHEYLERIVALEGVNVTEEGMKTLIFIADGDMRNAVNNLQAVRTSKDKVTKDAVFEVCDVPNTQTVELMYKHIRDCDFEEAMNIFDMIWNQNYCVHDLISYFTRVLEKTNEIDYKLKFELLNALAALKVRDSQGLGTKTQVLGTLARMFKIAATEAK